MVTIDSLLQKKEKIAVVGLGYVGLPLAVLLAKHFSVIGYDIDKKKVEDLQVGRDLTGEVSEEALVATNMVYTNNPSELKEVKVIIVSVPTPIDESNQPDLRILEKATREIAEYLQKGSIVIYESTVYPGVTEEVCVPIIEKISGLECKKDFWVGYSPERVNPGDKKHTIDTITKVVSAVDDTSLAVVSAIYGAITKTFPATSIRVAEAAKAIENAQRDLNIAFMNELAMLFTKMNISVHEVLDAAKTKWNFLPFSPGLVGGHCIGVDPYYLTHKANAVGHYPEVILSGRRINDSMHKFIAHEIIKKMIASRIDICNATVVLCGITFKENVPDIRNSKVVELYKELDSFGISSAVYDPIANPEDMIKEYGITLVKKDDLPQADVVIFAVAHDIFSSYDLQMVSTMVKPGGLLVDIKRMYQKKDILDANLHYWGL
tara:strand:+ start:360 stop:1661 length:1302 start_codon:yes stop_codon:yes gene_type:complete